MKTIIVIVALVISGCTAPGYYPAAVRSSADDAGRILSNADAGRALSARDVARLKQIIDRAEK